MAFRIPRVIDAHAHFGSETECALRERLGIETLLCATNPDEAPQVLASAAKYRSILPTFGLHPWHSGRFLASDMAEYLPQGVAIGEIGMDSVWCDVDLARQRRVFVEQLEFAKSLSKPVILHTKGQEAEILALLGPYSMKKLVHWFAEPALLSDYLALDCYFTIGPDILVNPVTQRVAEVVPLKRLMLETDGLSAVAWALGRKVVSEEIPALLDANLSHIAQIKRLPKENIRQALKQNMVDFLAQSNHLS